MVLTGNDVDLRSLAEDYDALRQILRKRVDRTDLVFSAFEAVSHWRSVWCESPAQNRPALTSRLLGPTSAWWISLEKAECSLPEVSVYDIGSMQWTLSQSTDAAHTHSPAGGQVCPETSFVVPTSLIADDTPSQQGLNSSVQDAVSHNTYLQGC